MNEPIRGIDPTLRPEAWHRQAMAAEIHATCIQGGFLPTLGRRFLTVVYRCIDEHPDCVLLTESIDGRVIGFIAGTTGKSSLRQVLRLHPFQACAAIAPSLLSVKRLKGMTRIARFAGQREGADPNWPAAELLSIAVDPAYRGKGVAERLFRRLEHAFGGLGVDSFRIIVGANLAPALRFYEKMGCIESGRLTIHGSALSIVLTRRINEAAE
jgi:ribosomal protein S18 acetylase RimI-like enzyme